MVVAERHSLVETFVRAGPTVLRLVSEHSRRALGTSRGRSFARAREVALPAPGADLVDPLTDRELEILSYLPTRFTNTELAEHFYVSVNTIKTHMAHIYRKLDVANRNARHHPGPGAREFSEPQRPGTAQAIVSTDRTPSHPSRVMTVACAPWFHSHAGICTDCRP